MDSLNGKIDSDAGAPGQLPAAEWNQVATELENIILDSGIVLSSGDLSQLSKALSNRVSNGNFYTESGSSNSYVLTPIGNNPGPTGFFDGMELNYTTSNANSGPSTVNPNGLGVKDIRQPGGAPVVTNQIFGRVKLVYSLSDDWFELKDALPSADSSSQGWFFVRYTYDIQFLIQFGSDTAGLSTGATSGGTTYSFQIAFPTACHSLIATPINQSSGMDIRARILSPTQFNLGSESGTPECYWIAIGL